MDSLVSGLKVVKSFHENGRKKCVKNFSYTSEKKRRVSSRAMITRKRKIEYADSSGEKGRACGGIVPDVFA